MSKEKYMEDEQGGDKQQKSVSRETKFYSRVYLANVATRSFTKFITLLHYTSTISWQITTSLGTPVSRSHEALEVR